MLTRATSSDIMTFVVSNILKSCLRKLFVEIIIYFEKWHLRLRVEIISSVKDPLYSLEVKDLEQNNSTRMIKQPEKLKC